jgi:TfoX/Sxy family transcriptional regulator of competence genes
MAYDIKLAKRVSQALDSIPGIVEKKMFGGIGYMITGNMACGVNKDDLIVRVGPEKYQEALDQPNVSVFDMSGRPMNGWVTVAPAGNADERDLKRWVQMGVDFASTLPEKP